MKKLAIAGIVVGGIAVTGYFVYKYYSKQQSASISQQNQRNNLDSIGTLLGDVQKSGGITGVIGSLF